MSKKVSTRVFSDNHNPNKPNPNYCLEMKNGMQTTPRHIWLIM